MSQTDGKSTFGHVRPAKIQIILRFGTVCSKSSSDAFWKANDAKFLDVDKEDCDQNVQSDLSLRWAHMREGTFSLVAPLYAIKTQFDWQ